MLGLHLHFQRGPSTSGQDNHMYIQTLCGTRTHELFRRLYCACTVSDNVSLDGSEVSEVRLWLIFYTEKLDSARLIPSAVASPVEEYQPVCLANLNGVANFMTVWSLAFHDAFVLPSLSPH